MSCTEALDIFYKLQTELYSNIDIDHSYDLHNMLDAVNVAIDALTYCIQVASQDDLRQFYDGK